MPQPPSPLPSVLGEIFTSKLARATGVTRRRLRAKDLEVPFRGVRVRRQSAVGHVLDASASDNPAPLARDRAISEEVLRKARAYLTIMPAHAFFAGRTAAILYGAPLTHGADLEVAVHSPARAARRRGISGVQISPTLATVHEHRGLRVASPASTWAMLASRLTTRELVALGDAFVRVPRDSRGLPLPGEQLATVEQLRAAIAAGPRTGIRRLRASVELIRVGSASPLETEYRLDAAAAGLPEPELDVDIHDLHGRRIGITEVVYRDWRVLVEIEGDHHRTSRAQWDRDIDKYADYAAEGWMVVRLTSRHIRGEHPRAVSIVRGALGRAGWGSPR